MVTLADFHNDQSLVQRVLRLSPSAVSRVARRYSTVLGSSRQAVAVHFTADATEWIVRVVREGFSASDVMFVVFAQDPLEARSVFLRLRQGHDQMRFMVVSETEPVALVLSSLCHHHVIGNSTLGFWGMLSMWCCAVCR